MNAAPETAGGAARAPLLTAIQLSRTGSPGLELGDQRPPPGS